MVCRSKIHTGVTAKMSLSFQRNRMEETNPEHPTSSEYNAIHDGFNGILCFLILFQVKHRMFKKRLLRVQFLFTLRLPESKHELVKVLMCGFLLPL
jgi:hypothetical protein